MNKYDEQRERLRQKPRRASPMQGLLDAAGRSAGPTVEEQARKNHLEARRLAAVRQGAVRPRKP